MNLSILYKKLTNRKYTIGYKFILSLFIGFVGIISFCSADSLLGTFDINYYSNKTPFEISFEHINDVNNMYVIFTSDYNMYLTYYYYNSYINFETNSIYNGSSFNIDSYCSSDSYCKYFTKVRVSRLYDSSNNVVNGVVHGYIYSKSSGGGGSSCPEIDTGAILSGYVPETDLLSCQSSLSGCQSSLNTCQSDYNTCQSNTSGFNDLLNSCSNNLNACNNSLSSCLQQNCPETVTGTNRSSLFINNIQYPGAPTIKFTIPEEIEREQNTDEEETNIDVIGYGYDQDKMQQMVNTQYYKPTAEEMSGLIEKVADFLPLVAIALLIIRIRRILKKVFKF